MFFLSSFSSRFAESLSGEFFTMNERRQLNIRLDNEPELYEAIRDQAHRMNVSMSAFIVMALKSALDWQIPFDAAALLKRVQGVETEVAGLKKREEEQRLALKRRDAQIQQTEDKIMNEISQLKFYVDILDTVNSVKKEIADSTLGMRKANPQK
jgi:predicted  nucleic acid-binding Zn-ribbon protein